jgi:cytochrome c biogenesis protein CcmG, thiol:disulfide interchange protein DsbE
VSDDLLNMMGRSVPRTQIARVVPPSVADARSELRGSPAALTDLHAQAGTLLGSTSALSARLHALRGYPIVLNVWASWCAPCRQEFPYLATASARYGRQIAFLGAAVSDPSGDARSFLRSHAVSYPSYSSSLSALAPLKLYPNGPPQTIFINRRGKVVFVHDGEYQSLDALENDIGQYSLGVKPADRPDAK